MIGEKKKEEGLGMPDFEIINKALNEIWIKRLFVTKSDTWKQVPLDYSENVGEKLIFECIFLPESVFDA